MYDVIIIGGGPAGASAGISLLGKGHKVLLIDKATFPREKICGGGISIRAINRFPFLSEHLNAIPVNYITKIYLQSPDHSEIIEKRHNPICFMIKRHYFDNMLLNICKHGGIEVLENTKLRGISLNENFVTLVTNSGETVKARLIIGADGANSTTARDLGLNPRWGTHQKAIIMTGEKDYGQRETIKRNTIYFFYGFGKSTGYGYVFPKSKSMDIGIGYLLSFYKEGVTEGLRKEYDRFVQYLATNGFLDSDAHTTHIRAAMLPVGGPLKKTYTDRILLCGDAAGFVNAFTAEGIYYAMVSGEIAAQVASMAIDRDKCDELFLSQYQDKWNSEIGVELYKSVKIQSRLFTNTKVINFIVKVASKSHSVRRLLTDYAIGQLAPESLNRRLLLRFFPFFVKYQLSKILR